MASSPRNDPTLTQWWLSLNDKDTYSKEKAEKENYPILSSLWEL